jgi:hypothetical protein
VCRRSPLAGLSSAGLGGRPAPKTHGGTPQAVSFDVLRQDWNDASLVLLLGLGALDWADVATLRADGSLGAALTRVVLDPLAGRLRLTSAHAPGEEYEVCAITPGVRTEALNRSPIRKHSTT